MCMGMVRREPTDGGGHCLIALRDAGNDCGIVAGGQMHGGKKMNWETYAGVLLCDITAATERLNILLKGSQGLPGLIESLDDEARTVRAARLLGAIDGKNKEARDRQERLVISELLVGNPLYADLIHRLDVARAELRLAEAEMAQQKNRLNAYGLQMQLVVSMVNDG